MNGINPIILAVGLLILFFQMVVGNECLACAEGSVCLQESIDACPLYSVLNGSSCICLPGFYGTLGIETTSHPTQRRLFSYQNGVAIPECQDVTVGSTNYALEFYGAFCKTIFDGNGPRSGFTSNFDYTDPTYSTSFFTDDSGLPPAGYLKQDYSSDYTTLTQLVNEADFRINTGSNMQSGMNIDVTYLQAVDYLSPPPGSRQGIGIITLNANKITLYKSGIANYADAVTALKSMSSVNDDANSPCEYGLTDRAKNLMQYMLDNNLPLENINDEDIQTRPLTQASAHVNNYKLHASTCADASLTWKAGILPVTETDSDTTYVLVNCTACPPDFYCPGGLQRVKCPNNSSSQYATSLNDCQCDPGFEKHGDECHICQPGHYDDQGICKECPQNTFSETAGMHICTRCSNGTGPAGSDSASNCQCNPGFKGEHNRCELCNKGHYTASHGLDACIPCEIGTYLDVKGGTACKNCPSTSTTLGTGTVHLSSCQCSPGYTGFPSCRPCATGQFASQSGVCVDCVQGFYASTPTDSCIKCPHNSTTSVTKSTHISDCKCLAGFEYVDGSCQACSAGKFKNILDNTLCESCPAGYFSEEASSECSKCPPDFYSSSASSGCAACVGNSSTGGLDARTSYNDCMCLPGFQHNLPDNNEMFSCIPCALGHYRSGQEKVVILNQSVPLTYTVVGQTYDSNPKYILNHEFIVTEGQAVTIDWSATPTHPFALSTSSAAPYVNPGDQITHVFDDTNHMTTITVHTSNVVLYYMCKFGHNFIGVPVTILPRPYANGHCQKCETGRTTLQRAASSIENCMPCPINTYQSNNAPDVTIDGYEYGADRICIPCPEFSISPPESTSEAQCECGYGYGFEGGQCVKCSHGSYSGHPSNEPCTKCPDGYGGNDADSQTLFLWESQACQACSAGQYEFNQICLPCPEHSSSEQTSTSCVCNPGFSPMSNHTCHPCAPGERSPGENHKCMPCTSGRYSTTPPSAFCKKCPTNSSSLPNASSIHDCVCDPGFHFENDVCVSCPEGKFTNASNLCETCIANFYYPETTPPFIDNHCQKCPNNSSSSAGAYTQNDCHCDAGFVKMYNNLNEDGSSQRRLLAYTGGEAIPECQDVSVGSDNYALEFFGSLCETIFNDEGPVSPFSANFDYMDTSYSTFFLLGADGSFPPAAYVKTDYIHPQFLTSTQIVDEALFRENTGSNMPGNEMAIDVTYIQTLNVLEFVDGQNQRRGGGKMLSLNADQNLNVYRSGINSYADAIAAIKTMSSVDDNVNSPCQSKLTVRTKTLMQYMLDNGIPLENIDSAEIQTRAVTSDEAGLVDVHNFKLHDSTCADATLTWKPQVDTTETIAETIAPATIPIPSINYKCQLCTNGSYCPDENTIVKCPAFSTSAAGASSINSCACAPGYFGDAPNCQTCLPDFYCPGSGQLIACRANSSTLTTSGQSSENACMCLPGFYLQGDECVECQAGSYCYENQLIKCPANSTSARSADSTLECVCNAGLRKQNGACVACDNSLICLGMTALSDSILQCANNATTENLQQKCTCMPGMYCSNPDQEYGCLKSDAECKVCNHHPDIQQGYCFDNAKHACFGNSSAKDDAHTIDDCVCVDGFYENEENNCKQCPHNVYCTQGTLTSCTTHDPHLITSTQSMGDRSDCMCTAGYFRTNKQDTCKLCSKDFYCMSEIIVGLPNIVACRENEYTYHEGSTSWTDCICDAGHKLSTEDGVMKCLPCLPGQRCQFGEVQEEACHLEYRVPLSDHSQCVCDKARFQNSVLQCEPCAEGTVKNDIGNEACTPCPANSFAVNLTHCELCESPSVSLPGSTSCHCIPPYNISCGLCELNSYLLGTRCESCPSNSHTKAPGAVGQSECHCNPGYIQTAQHTCIACPANFYEENGVCIACPAHSASPIASPSADSCICQNCSAKTLSLPVCLGSCPTNVSCTACEAGYVQPDHANNLCVACDHGTFQPYEGQAECDLCATTRNTHFQASTNLSDCDCRPGHEPDQAIPHDQSMNCTLCTFGFAKHDLGDHLCSPCLNNFFADENGMLYCKFCGDFTTIKDANFTVNSSAVSVDECTCNHGSFLSDDICQLCVAGSFKSSVGAHACTFCGSSGEYQNHFGSDQTGAIDDSHCTLCPSNSGQDPEVVGESLTMVGVLDCQCFPGFEYTYPDDTFFEANGCTQCSDYKIQTQYSRGAKCQFCETDHYFRTHAKECFSCQLSDYLGGENHSIAYNSLYNNYSWAASQQDCVCRDGYERRGFICHECESGKFRSLDLFSQLCINCPPNTFSAGIGLSQCVSCPPNSFLPGDGGIDLQQCLCAAGFEWNTTHCVPCQPGFFKAINDSVNSDGASVRETCQVCPSGFYTDRYATVNCSACNINMHSELPRDNVETCECNPGFGGDPCTACALGTFSAGGISTDQHQVCRNCPAGKTTLTLQTIVVDECYCLPGHGTANYTAEAPCHQCLNGFYADGYANIPCSYCGFGAITDPPIGALFVDACLCDYEIGLFENGTKVPIIDKHAVEMVVALPYTVEEFDEELQTDFKEGVAATAGVSEDKVEITSIEAIDTARRRRLLNAGIDIKFRILAKTENVATALTTRMDETALNEALESKGMQKAVVKKKPRIKRTDRTGFASELDPAWKPCNDGNYFSQEGDLSCTYFMFHHSLSSDCIEKDQCGNYGFLRDGNLDFYLENIHNEYCVSEADGGYGHEDIITNCCGCGGGNRDDRCVDQSLPNDKWTDSEGYSCLEYEMYEPRCDLAKRYRNHGITALDACCVCGGGKAPPGPIITRPFETLIDLTDKPYTFFTGADCQEFNRRDACPVTANNQNTGNYFRHYVIARIWSPFWNRHQLYLRTRREDTDFAPSPTQSRMWIRLDFGKKVRMSAVSVHYMKWRQAFHPTLYGPSAVTFVKIGNGPVLDDPVNIDVGKFMEFNEQPRQRDKWEDTYGYEPQNIIHFSNTLAQYVYFYVKPHAELTLEEQEFNWLDKWAVEGVHVWQEDLGPENNEPVLDDWMEHTQPSWKPWNDEAKRKGPEWSGVVVNHPLWGYALQGSTNFAKFNVPQPTTTTSTTTPEPTTSTTTPEPTTTPPPPQTHCSYDESNIMLSYTFDDADNAGLDSGIYANDAVPNSVAVSTSQVKQGTSSAVMTNTNYLQLPNINLDHDEISIAFWIQVDLDTTIKDSWNRIFRLHNSNSKTVSCGFFRDYRPGSVFFFVGNGNSPTTYSQVDEVSDHPGVGDANTAEVILHNHEWYHITWSMSVSKQEWHIDVSGIGAFTFTGMLTHERNIYNDNVINSKTGKNWVGFIDNFQIYTKVLNAQEISSIREKGNICAPSSSVTAHENLVIWYRFENNFDDSSGNGYDATNPGNGATFSSVAKIGDSSLRQDGYTQAQSTQVRFPDTFDLYNTWKDNGVSIALWFKIPLDSSNHWANLLFQFSDKESDEWPINRITLGQRGVDNGFWLGINDPILGNDVRYKYAHVLDNYLDDTWHHTTLIIAANGVWSLYIDSVDTGEIFTHTSP